MHSDHETEPRDEAEERRELSDDELDDVAGGSEMSTGKFGIE
jgi:hypothetical protein